MSEAIGGATWHVLPGEGHYAIVRVPEKIARGLPAGSGIPRELVPKRSAHRPVGGPIGEVTRRRLRAVVSYPDRTSETA